MSKPIDIIEAREWLIFASKLLAQSRNYVEMCDIDYSTTDAGLHTKFNSDLERVAQELAYVSADMSELLSQVEKL